MRSAAPKSHHPNYARLTTYLKRRRQHQITLSFAQLELGILLGPLPWAARGQSGWWSNTQNLNKPQGRAWLDAGWRVAAANQIAETVTFDRFVPSP